MKWLSQYSQKIISYIYETRTDRNNPAVYYDCSNSMDFNSIDMKETTFERIIRKTGMKPVSCKCQQCKLQCKAPCLGTPEDMKKLIQAGFEKRLMKILVENVWVVMPLYDKGKQSCTFFTNGLCELHDAGLKPTVGKLSHHSTTIQKFNPKKSIHRFVLDEWRQK